MRNNTEDILSVKNTYINGATLPVSQLEVLVYNKGNRFEKCFKKFANPLSEGNLTRK